MSSGRVGSSGDWDTPLFCPYVVLSRSFMALWVCQLARRCIIMTMQCGWSLLGGNSHDHLDLGWFWLISLSHFGFLAFCL